VGIEKDTGGKETPYVGINDVMLSIKAVVDASCIRSLIFYILMLTWIFGGYVYNYLFILQNVYVFSSL